MSINYFKHLIHFVHLSLRELADRPLDRLVVRLVQREAEDHLVRVVQRRPVAVSARMYLDEANHALAAARLEAARGALDNFVMAVEAAAAGEKARKRESGSAS